MKPRNRRRTNSSYIFCGCVCVYFYNHFMCGCERRMSIICTTAHLCVAVFFCGQQIITLNWMEQIILWKHTVENINIVACTLVLLVLVVDVDFLLCGLLNGEEARLTFAIVVGTADNFAVRHVGTLLATALAVHFTHFIITIHGVAAHLLAALFFVRLLWMLQCNHLLHLLRRQLMSMIFSAVTTNQLHCLCGRIERWCGCCFSLDLGKFWFSEIYDRHILVQRFVRLDGW